MTRSKDYDESDSQLTARMGGMAGSTSHAKAGDQRLDHYQQRQQLQPQGSQGRAIIPQPPSSPLRPSPVTTPSHSPRRPGLSPVWHNATHHHFLSAEEAASAGVLGSSCSNSPLGSPVAATVPSTPYSSTGLLLFSSTSQEHDLVLPPSPTPPRRVSSPGLVLSSQFDTSMTSSPSSPFLATTPSQMRRGSRVLSTSAELLPDYQMLSPVARTSTTLPTRRLSTPRLADVPMSSPECSQLGKHPKTPSPDEPRARIKGIKTLSGKALDTPLRMPDFTTSQDTSGLDRSMPLLSPVSRPPHSGLVLSPTNGSGRPKTGLFSEEINRLASTRGRHHNQRAMRQTGAAAGASGAAKDDDIDNPFLQHPQKHEKQEMIKGDFLTSSQWYSEYAHHITKAYLDALFRQDRVVMFVDEDMETDSKSDYMERQHEVIRPFLSHGEFSDVIHVKDRVTRTGAVVKRLRKTVHGAMERKRYLNEVRNLWRITPSPNVIRLLDAWEQQGRIYMKTELCEYGSLHSIMMDHKLRGGFSEDTIWRCLSDLAWGLKAIHDENILHLDFKPANIFVASRGVLKIGDFGHSCERPVVDTDGKEGDRCYMAQELLQGHCDYYSDIFSLGATIFEMACNRIGDMPGEGPEWHRIRDGNLDFELLLSSRWDPHALPTVTLPIISPPPEPSLSQEKAVPVTPTTSTTAITGSFTCDSAPSTPTATPPLATTVYKPSLKFSQTLMDLISDMMQPEFELRPLTDSILSNPRLLHASRSMTRSMTRSKGLNKSDAAREGALIDLLKPSYSIC